MHWAEKRETMKGTGLCDKKTKYKVLKTISIKAIEESGPKDCESFMNGVYKFTYLIIKEFTYQESAWIISGFSHAGIYSVDRIIKCASQVDGFIKFLLDKGFIAEYQQWEPCGVKFRFETEDDLKGMYHYLNQSWEVVKKKATPDTVDIPNVFCNKAIEYYEQISDLCIEKGLKKKGA
jgi:hypothetical protein